MRQKIQLFHFDCFAVLACSQEDFNEESYFFTYGGFFLTRQAAEEFAISYERARVEGVYSDWANHSFNVRGTIAEHPAPTMFAIVPLASVQTNPTCPLSDLENSIED